MAIKYFPILLAFLLFSMLVSCEGKLDPVSAGGIEPTLICKGDNGELPNEQTHAIYNLDGNILFSINNGECYCCDPRRTALRIRQVTEYIYPWYNLTILSDIEVGPGTIDITHNGINVPNILQDALGPANALAYFDIPDGFYRLTFHYNGVSDTYRLIVAAGKTSMHPIATSYTHLMTDR